MGGRVVRPKGVGAERCIGGRSGFVGLGIYAT
jgi:hypothetical protein